MSGSPRVNGRCLELLACFPEHENENRSLHRYIKQLAASLQGRLHWQLAENELTTVSDVNQQRHYDLLLLNEAGWLSRVQQTGNLAVSANELRQSEQPAIWLARQPCWPLRRLLLIIRGEATDKVAIEWGVHLTRLTQATLTLLVVMPPLIQEKEQFIANALKASTIPGRHIRTALHHLALSQIEGVLKLSHRLPEQQVQLEVTSSQYDLIILGSDPPGRLFYWRLDSLLRPLLRWTQQSVLITGSQSPFDKLSMAEEEHMT